MEKNRKMLAYLIGIAVAFYTSPFIVKDTGSAMLVLLLLLPNICFILSFLYGIKNQFNWLFPVLVGFLFIPTLFIFYNDSALIYSFIYSAIALIGNLLGSLTSKFKKRNV